MELRLAVLARGWRGGDLRRTGPTGSRPSASASAPSSRRRWEHWSPQERNRASPAGGGQLAVSNQSPEQSGPQSADPGWRSAFSAMSWLIVPGWGITRQSRRVGGGRHGLTMLRQLFVNFAAALVLIGLVVVVLSATTKLTPHPLPVTAVAVAVVAVGAIALSASHLFERPLDCTNDDRLAASYRTRFFLRVAFSEAVSLVGFVGFILSNTGWLYALGALFTAIGYYRLAPTAAHLASLSINFQGD
ncbi:MAG: hypothetical protein QOF30_2298 [Acidimicrobiaceae bacterium]|nr:hypothetical protein [Acidimicrobiaceae bacterium]